ncbi:ParB/RepB/Spo0J family partition protein, partial [uncultured Nostoc sp.]
KPTLLWRYCCLILSEVLLIENFARSGLTDLEETDGIVRLLAVKLKISPQEVPPLLHHIQNQQRGRTAANNVIGNDVISVVEEVLTSLGNIKLDSFISNRLPLLNLPSDFLEVLRQGKLETSKAKAIARVGDEKTRKQFLEDAIAYNLSLSEIKRKIQEIEQQSKSESSQQTESASIKDRVDDTFQRFKKAKVWDDPKKKSKVEKLLAQLDALMQGDNPK